MKPPRPSPPKTVVVVPADPGQVVGRGRGPLDLGAVVGGDLLGDPGRGHRQRHPAAAPLGGDQVEHHQQRPVVLDDPAALVDEREPLTDRVEADAEGRARGGDDLARAGPVRSGATRPVSVGRDSSRPGLMVRASTPSRPSRLGRTSPALPLEASTTTLSPASAMPVVSTARSSEPVYESKTLDGEVQVADLAGEGPAVLLACVDPVQLALAGLRRGRRRARRRT